MLNVYSSNRLERLVDELAGRTQAFPLGPFDRETIVVQGPGMARWLRLQLAHRLGVCALVDFPLPGTLVWALVKNVLPDLRQRRELETDLLTWSLMDLIARHREEPAFGAIRAYLGQGGNQLYLYQLACQAGRVFSNYALFRPDLLAAWQAGDALLDRDPAARDAEAWQAVLWRDLAKRFEWEPWTVLYDRLAGRLLPSAGADALPPRISIFGLSALPPVYLRIFETLGRRTEVDLYVMSPCRQYWGLIESDRETARRERKGRGGSDQHRETGNRLLASLGQLGREFLNLREALTYHEPAGDLYEAPDRETLLGRVQSQIFDLEEPAGDSPVAPDDRSVQIHVCHSAMREVEVLHDRLLGLLDGDADLSPQDIVVMAPDIEGYAPLVEAVFGAASRTTRIPFSIADRAPHRLSRVHQAFFALLDLAQGRYEASEVLALLDHPAVHRRFGLLHEDLDSVRTWLEATRVRWGIDAAYRASLGLPAEPAHTWRAGLERMLLGYALPGDGLSLFDGSLPYPEIEGQDAAVLGKLAGFFDALAGTLEGLRAPRAPAAWAADLAGILDRFIDTDDDGETEADALRTVFGALSEKTAEAGFEGDLEFPVVRTFLDQSLGSEGMSTPFISGGVTFCSMVPMRSVPFRVVAILGMNDGDFPRNPRPPGFDLMARERRAGDRSARFDDRYLFLEALLSARDHLYISYVGRDVRENKEIPPSVLVSEFTDYLSADGGEEALERYIITRHPLQPFNPDYFQPCGALFSYSDTYRAASEALSRPPVPFRLFEEPLPPGLRAPGEVVPLDDFAGFFARPARALMAERLGVKRPWTKVAAEDREPFAVGRGDRRAAAGMLLAPALEKRAPEDPVGLLEAASLLPHGTVGRLRGADLVSEIQALAQRIGGAAEGLPRSVPVDLEVGGARLVGRLDRVYASLRLGWNFDPIWTNDLLRAWVEHLVLNALGDETLPKVTALYGTDKTHRLLPVEDPKTLLEPLVEMYRRGLDQPVHLFPKASLAYAETMVKKADHDAALARARGVWRDGYVKGERTRDEDLSLLFDERAVEHPAFAEDSMTVFGPLLKHHEDASV